MGERKQQSSQPAQSFKVNLKRVLVDRDAAPTVAHKFTWTRVGQEIELEVGVFDLNELRVRLEEAKKDPEKTFDVDLRIVHRYGLSAQAVIDLAQTANAMAKDLAENGLLTTHGPMVADRKGDPE